MGKRELLLIFAFATVGALVYYATAPAATPGQQGFSVPRIVEGLRREIRGNRSSAEVTTTTAIPLKSGVTEVRFETGNAPLTIAGEDRADLLCELQAWSSGYDETEAKKYAAETALQDDRGRRQPGHWAQVPGAGDAARDARRPDAEIDGGQNPAEPGQARDSRRRLGRARRGARRGHRQPDLRPRDGHAPRRRPGD